MFLFLSPINGILKGEFVSRELLDTYCVALKYILVVLNYGI